MPMLKPTRCKGNSATPTSLSLVTKDMDISVERGLLTKIDEGLRYRTDFDCDTLLVYQIKGG